MGECDCLEDLRFCDQYISYFSVLFYPRICVKMSEDEREIDVESEDEEYARNGGGTMDKRAHHNALERKRRDHIKDSFTGLRDAIPTMKGGDKSSRAQILKKASEYIQYMRRKNSINQTDLEDPKRQNNHMEAQIRALEKAKTVGNFSSAKEILSDQDLMAEGESMPTSNDLGTSPYAKSSVAPGQSLLLNSPDNVTLNNVDSPRKKMKQLRILMKNFKIILCNAKKISIF